ncbi:hypothetical protein [Levilactobacillus suantsaii]|uniref:Uncharacterized protein n=1 Tax=Levilactobacillus suantsaii TaxID=2292255 RepID=A0A4V1LF37_9LACO|nr:hypothetical protein [Levilactobacillus suantsaii]QMU08345.1 hypothetical protein H3M12_01305 [Levilactobacillus suantsaii]RXI75714.1 hypothetical protein DXH47_11410 [Levilactobacillus suantsaii]
MLTIYVDPKQQDQVVQLSDQDRGYLTVSRSAHTARYTFSFTGHAHPSFWCDGRLTDGLEETVRSIDGEQRYRIEFR